MARYWRIRLKNQDGDHAEAAWQRGEVGIWYGAWSASDYRNSRVNQRTNQEVADEWNALDAQEKLLDSGAWDGPIPASYVDPARRFFDKVSGGDFAIVYLPSKPAIGVGKFSERVLSESSHPLNTKGGEIYKYRKLDEQKLFELSHLPDAYRLLPTQGYGNVHEFSKMYEHVKILVESTNCDQLMGTLKGLSFDEQLDLMGASAWESFCVSWLIMERNFVPTGLSTGRTLKSVDIVGRNRVTGRRIIAQCKKDPVPVTIDDEFSASVAPGDEGYFFAYGGCNGQGGPSEIRVIDRSYARKWSKTQNGVEFERLFLAG